MKGGGRREEEGENRLLCTCRAPDHIQMPRSWPPMPVPKPMRHASANVNLHLILSVIVTTSRAMDIWGSIIEKGLYMG